MSIKTREEMLDAAIPYEKPLDKDRRLCGVYLLIKNEEIVYVGQSINVDRRVKDHATHKSFDRVALVPCQREKLIPLEADYIRVFNPRLNIVRPMGGDWVEIDDFVFSINTRIQGSEKLTEKALLETNDLMVLDILGERCVHRTREIESLLLEQYTAALGHATGPALAQQSSSSGEGG